MTYLSDARAQLDKAREFLESARDGYDFDRFNAAASSAVISGINSKDAICLRVDFRTSGALQRGRGRQASGVSAGAPAVIAVDDV